jgi:endonuclease YncB( thermonuclease family)
LEEYPPQQVAGAMRWSHTFLLFFLLAHSLAPAQDRSVRTWTDDTGRFQIVAEYLGYVDGKVSLRKQDGQTVVVPVDRLSRSDQALVKSLAAAIVGQVVGVTDGDTITVLDSSKTQHKIRLNGIDAPESSQAFGARAKQALSDKVFGKQVRVDWKERDRYDRILGDVYVDDRHINVDMVQEGWAWHFKKYSSDENLAGTEVAARVARRGLWTDPNPVPPWEFRNPTPIQPLAATSPSPPSSLQDATVYVTRTGEKYHTGSCRHLSKSRIPVSIAEARQRYSPCSVCNPPR